MSPPPASSASSAHTSSSQTRWKPSTDLSGPKLFQHAILVVVVIVVVVPFGLRLFLKGITESLTSEERCLELVLVFVDSVEVAMVYAASV